MMRKQMAADQRWSLMGTWAAKQLEISGTALPSDFPKREQLEALYYTTYEDLDGADECELTEQGFSTRDAAAILAAASP